MNFQELNALLKKVNDNSYLKLDIEDINQEMISQFRRFLQIDKLLYLHHSYYKAINQNEISLSGQIHLEYSPTFFYIKITFFNNNNAIDYILSIEPSGSWENEIDESLKKIMDVVPVEMTGNIFVCASKTINAYNVLFENGRVYEVAVEKGLSIAAKIKSDLLDLIGMSEELFFITGSLDAIKISRALNIKLNIAGLITLNIKQLTFIGVNQLILKGTIKLPFGNNATQLELDCDFSIGKDGYACRIFCDEIDLPIEKILRGLDIYNLEIDFQGSFSNPGAFIFGMAGDFAIKGEPRPSKNPHDFTYANLNPNEFHLKFIPSSGSYVPVYIQAFVKEISLSKALTMLSGSVVRLPSFIDPIKLYSTCVYYCAPGQVAILVNGVKAEPGLSISSGIAVLGLDAYCEYSQMENGPIRGKLHVEPLIIKNLLEIRGKGEGSPDNYKGKPIEKGGMHLNFEYDNQQLTFDTSIKGKLLNFLEIGAEAQYNSNGLTFIQDYKVAGQKINLLCTFRDKDCFRMASDINLSVHVKKDLGILGKLDVSVGVDCFLEFILEKENPSTSIDLKFNIMQNSIRLMKLKFDLQDLQNLEERIEREILQVLEKLLEKALEWLKAVLEGIIKVAEDVLREAQEIARVLVEHFTLTVERAILLLKDAQYSIDRVAQILRDGFERTATQVAALLKEAEYAIAKILSAIKNEFGLAAEAAGEILKKLQYDVNEVAKALGDVYDLSAKQVAALLHQIGYGASDIARVLHDIFDVGRGAAGDILRELGHTGSVVTDVLGSVWGSVGGGGCLVEEKDLLYLSVNNELIDNYKINTLRRFRDEIMLADDQNKDFFNAYITSSTQILNKFNDVETKKAMLKNVYHEVVIDLVYLLEKGTKEELLDFMKKRIDWLKSTY